ncbi:MAG: hypothetical protein JSS49_05315 [Planctomycetes bacterium]|nr:hypothetical protein [Planctomycetota bacterium]
MSNDFASDLPTADDNFDDGFGSPEYGFDDMDAGGADANKVGSGSLRVDKKGWYLFRIEATAKPKPYHDDDMSKKRAPSVGLVMHVEASDNGTPPGAVQFHDLVLGGYGGGPPEDWQRDQTLNFLVGAGVLIKQGEKVIDPETNSTIVKSSTLAPRLNGLRVFGKVELSPARPKKKDGLEQLDKDGNVVMYAERLEFPFGRGIFAVNMKEIAHHKWADEALKAAGIVRNAKPNA